MIGLLFAIESGGGKSPKKIMKKAINLIFSFGGLFLFAFSAFADVKVRQKTMMTGQSFETTKMIKGGGNAGTMMSQIAEIEQCDLRREFLINDAKKLYFIEPSPKKAPSQIKYRQFSQPEVLACK